MDQVAPSTFWGRTALIRAVDAVALSRARIGFAGEDPEVGAAGIEVQVESLGRSTNLNRDEVLKVAAIWGSGDVAAAALDELGRLDSLDSLDQSVGDWDAVLGVSTS